MTDLDLDDMMNKIAQAMLDYDDALTAIVKDLPDENFAPLVAELRRRAQPDDPSSPEAIRRGVVKNFAMPEYDHIADHIQAELGLRIAFRRAAEHEKATGEGFYCLHCGGSCRPENHENLDPNGACISVSGEFWENLEKNK